MQDVHNIIFDRKHFLDERDRLKKYEDIIFDLKMRGLEINMATSTVEDVGRAFQEMCDEARRDRNELFALRSQVNSLKNAWRGLFGI